MPVTVLVVGGGYAGIAVAKALDDVAEVVLVEPRDRFVHNVAMLRALVDSTWTDRIFLPYDRLLERGRVIRDRAVRVDGTSVALGSGELIQPDYLVLATGSTYPFPAKPESDDSAQVMTRLHHTRAALGEAGRVLLLGAGPVGLELAGEIKAAWPHKTVTVLDSAPDILSGRFPDEFRTVLRDQLDELGVRLMLGAALDGQPPSEPGDAKTFSVSTQSGEKITADVWFRCYGAVPNTGYLAGPLTDTRLATGHLAITPELRLPAQDRVFAIGDLTALPEAKMAKAAGQHAEVVAANIRTLIGGGSELTVYQPAAPGISLPLGPAGGASYAAEVGVLGAEQTAALKGTHLRMNSYLTLLGLR